MTKLERMIAELCPSGVEYKKLGEIAEIHRGGNLQKKDFRSDGIPCIHYGQIYTKYGLFANQTISFVSEECSKKQKLAQPNDIIMAVTSENIEDVCKCVAWLGDREVAVSGHTAIIRHHQNAKFLTYYFHTDMFTVQKRKLAHGTKVIEVTPSTLGNLYIPVPPLEIQQEIVRILDNFTELSAELSARLKQYEFYRDALLTAPSKSAMKCLGETCDMRAGKAIRSVCISDKQEKSTPIPCYGGNGRRGFVSDFNYDGEFPIIGRQGALCGNVNFASGKFYATEHAVVVNSKGSYQPRFLFHLLTHMDLNRYKSAGAQPGLAVKTLAEISAPVPPMEVQERIAHVLDNFEAICSDLRIGLPAEIAARKKQYEYYRDALLTFAATGETIFTDRQTEHK